MFIFSNVLYCVSKSNFSEALLTLFETEDDEWLIVQIQKKSIPFCLVRSKVDKEVDSKNGRKVGEKGTLLQIRHTIQHYLPDNKAFAKDELFLISSAANLQCFHYAFDQGQRL
jgi:hypothetical protein